MHSLPCPHAAEQERTPLDFECTLSRRLSFTPHETADASPTAGRELTIAEVSRYIELVRAGEATTSQRLQIMIDQRERILAQVQQLELALATTEHKITTYGGAPSAHRPQGDHS